MLTLIIFRLWTLAGAATTAADVGDGSDEVVSSPRVAQVRLAETLAAADAIHSVVVRGKTITFAVTRGDRPLSITATTNATHDVVALAITSSTGSDAGLGGLSWLASELESTAAVTKLVPDEDGAVTVTTADDRRYMVIPGRGSGGNTAVEARWAGEWDR
ncbi:MAG: hypothetical protein ABI867_20500 [Kofleriaceae bacterium]